MGVNVVGGDVIRSSARTAARVRLPTGVDAARRGCRVGRDALPRYESTAATPPFTLAPPTPPVRLTRTPGSSPPSFVGASAMWSPRPSPPRSSASETGWGLRRRRAPAGGASVKGGVAATAAATRQGAAADTASPAKAAGRRPLPPRTGPSSPEPLTPPIPIPADHLRRLTAPILTICDGSAKTRPVPTQIQRRRDRVGAGGAAPAGRRQGA